jgi:hypothetical protein
VGFGPHRQLLEAIERSIQRDIARNGEVLQGGSKALQDLIKDRFEASDGAQDEDLAIEKVGNAEEDCNSPTSFENYVDDLMAQMERPHATDPALNNLLNRLYRPNATVGSGSTASAVRQEAITGQPVGGKFHTQKAEESIRALQRWLNNNPNAPTVDRAAAENVIKDLSNALGR